MTIYIIPVSQFVGHLPSDQVDTVIHAHQYISANQLVDFYIFCSFHAFTTTHHRNRTSTFRVSCRIWYHGHHPGINEFSPAINHRIFLTQEEELDPPRAFGVICQNLWDTYVNIHTPTPSDSSEEQVQN